MSYQRLVYTEADSTEMMRHDCRHAAVLIRRNRPTLAERVTAPTPSILFADNDHEVVKSEIKVSDAAARLATALHLHLD